MNEIDETIISPLAITLYVVYKVLFFTRADKINVFHVSTPIYFMYHHVLTHRAHADAAATQRCAERVRRRQRGSERSAMHGAFHRGMRTQSSDTLTKHTHTETQTVLLDPICVALGRAPTSHLQQNRWFRNTSKTMRNHSSGRAFGDATFSLCLCRVENTFSHHFNILSPHHLTRS
jgi:hypothetical protein